MATSSLIRSQLRLIFDNGTHPTTGKPVFKTKSFNHVKTNATADQLHAVAQALGALQTLPLFNVERFDYSEISR